MDEEARAVPKRARGGGDHIHLTPAIAGCILAMAATGRTLRKAFVLNGLDAQTFYRYKAAVAKYSEDPPDAYLSAFFELATRALEIGLEAQYHAKRRLILGAKFRTLVTTRKRATKQRIVGGEIVELIDTDETVRESLRERAPQLLPILEYDD